MLPPSRLVKLGKVELVSCLDWQTLPGMDGVKPIAEARAHAKEANTTYGALYEQPASKYQIVGLLGPDSPKGCIGKHALAPILAEKVTNRLIYLEAMDPRGSNYYLLSVKPGEIDARTDKIITDDDAVKLISDMLQEHFAQPKVMIDFILGGDVPPPSGNMLERHPPRKGSLAEFLPDAFPKTLRVRQLVGVPPAAVFSTLAIAAAVLLVIGAGWWWRNEQAKRELQAQMDAMVAASAQTGGPNNALEIRLQEALRNQLAIDSQTFAPSQFLEACQKSRDVLRPALGGWRLTQIVCDPATLGATASYARVGAGQDIGATNQSFVAAARRVGLQPAIDFGAETVTVTAPLQQLVKRSALDMAQLPARTEAAVFLPTQFQRLATAVPDAKASVAAPAPVDIKFQDPTKANLPPEQQMVSVPADKTYLKGSITLATNSAWVLNAIRLDWPYVALTKVTIQAGQLGQDQWTLEAQYLVKNG